MICAVHSFHEEASMRRHLLVLVLCSLVTWLAFWALAQAGDGGLKAKGQIKLGDHRLKLETDKLYEVRVEADGFRPMVLIRPGQFLFTQDRLGRDREGDDVFHAYFMPDETRNHRLLITPDTYGDLGDSPFEYSVTVKPIPLPAKPEIAVKDKLTADDPAYKRADSTRNSHCKIYPIKMNAKQLYVIDMISKTYEPFLYVEGPDG